MIKISGKTIRMTKGDTLEVPVIIMTKNGEIYLTAEGDVIRFAMKKTYEDAEPLILKTINRNLNYIGRKLELLNATIAKNGIAVLPTEHIEEKGEEE